MTKAELVEAIAAKSGLTKADSSRALEAFMDVVGETLKKGDKITLTGFGSFGVSRREAREFLSNNAISLDGDIINDENHKITKNRKYHIIRKGKKKYYLIKMN